MTDEKYKWQVIGVSVIVSITALLIISLAWITKSPISFLGVLFLLTIFFVPTEEIEEGGSSKMKCPECGHEFEISEEETE